METFQVSCKIKDCSRILAQRKIHLCTLPKRVLHTGQINFHYNTCIYGCNHCGLLLIGTVSAKPYHRCGSFQTNVLKRFTIGQIQRPIISWLLSLSRMLYKIWFSGDSQKLYIPQPHPHNQRSGILWKIASSRKCERSAWHFGLQANQDATKFKTLCHLWKMVVPKICQTRTAKIGSR